MLGELGIKDDPLLDLAMELERIALHDEYFISRKLYPNVDFYSGIILKAMGFPTSMFTVLFAVARTVGWISQWKEMIEDPAQRIGRPRQIYTGADSARLRAARRPRLTLAPPPNRRPVPRQSPARRKASGLCSFLGRQFADESRVSRTIFAGRRATHLRLTSLCITFCTAC